jgi:hypothetical protein
MKYYVVYGYTDQKLGVCVTCEVVCLDGIESEDDLIEMRNQLRYKDNNPVIINWKLLA